MNIRSVYCFEILDSATYRTFKTLVVCYIFFKQIDDIITDLLTFVNIENLRGENNDIK